MLKTSNTGFPADWFAAHGYGSMDPDGSDDETGSPALLAYCEGGFHDKIEISKHAMDFQGLHYFNNEVLKVRSPTHNPNLKKY